MVDLVSVSTLSNGVIAQLGEVSNAVCQGRRIFIDNLNSARLKPTSASHLEVAGSIPARPMYFFVTVHFFELCKTLGKFRNYSRCCVLVCA